MPWRLPLAQPIYTIFGANTGVGKTIISTLLVKSLAPNVSYIKPVSTGPLSDADYLHVDKFTGVEGKVLYQFDEPCSPHIAAGPEVCRKYWLTEYATKEFSLQRTLSSCKDWQRNSKAGPTNPH